MKKIALSLAIISSILLINSSFAYSPNYDENQKLEYIYKQIDNLYTDKKIDKIIRIKNKINSKIEKNRNHEKNMYFLRLIKNKLVSYIEKHEKIKKEARAKAKLLEVKKETNPKKVFVNKYWNQISWEITNACIKNYDFVDKIAKEQDFPTALIIAMWKKEHNCYLDNPANGWWAFQITSRYYNPGEISLEEFKQEVIDFINFSKNKIAYYNKDSGKFKAIFGKEDIVLNYSNYSARNIRLYALLYNWIKKSTNINTFLFANANLNWDLKSNSDWILTTFVKVLKWELK